MELIKCFSENYANAVTAFSALGALILATITLIYLKREYSAKYRPYVTPIVHTEIIPGKLGCIVSIHPKNIGSHPCKANATVNGNSAYGSANTNATIRHYEKPKSTVTQLPPNTVEFLFNPNDKTLKLDGVSVEITQVTSYSISYVLRKQ